jgi:hypothetical protein
VVGGPLEQYQLSGFINDLPLTSIFPRKLKTSVVHPSIPDVIIPASYLLTQYLAALVVNGIRPLEKLIALLLYTQQATLTDVCTTQSKQ